MKSTLKIFALLFAGTLVIALAACDDNPIDPPDPSCTSNTNTIECAVEAGEVVYDTSGSIITVADVGNGVAPRANEVMWSSDYEYILDGFTFVNDGQVLTIEPGTVVRGKPGQGTNASALIVARGGAIMAEGTASDPIIFTAESDPLDGSLEINNGLWGGVILLGRATLNVATGETNIEGIPTTEERGLYGGDNDSDNSGVLRYVSIRHGGTDIGEANEINGLTMGGVGSGTTVEYVEVFANKDDGVEWFGGTVNTSHLVVAMNGDDLFDYDQGWRGNNQFWFGIKPATESGNLGEHDGGTDGDNDEPFATPTVYNATLIGSGVASGGTDGIKFRDGAGGFYYNSIVTEAVGYAVGVEDNTSVGGGSRERLEAGDLALENNLFGSFGVGTSPTDLFPSLNTDGDPDGNTWFSDYMTDAAQANVIDDPMLTILCWTEGCGLDPRPASGSPALSMDLFAYSGGFFTPVDYAGAFGPGDTWMNGWTALDQYGYINM